MKESQENIKKINAEGVSGSNSVKVVLDGEGEMQKIEISDEIFKEEKSIIEDLIVAAHNNAKVKIKNKTNLGHRGFAVGSAHSVAVFSFYHRLLAVPQLGQRGCLVERGFKAVGKFIADQVRVRVAVVVSADARLVGSVDDIRGIAAGVWVNKARRHYNCPYSRYGNRDELTPRL